MSKNAPSRLGLARTTACALLMLLPVAYASGQQQPSGVAFSPALGAYDVVALRVEFQPDTTRFTTGDGTFAGSLFGDGLEPKVDPLPHDAGYFEAHLAFLEHYVATVSDGRANVRTWLLPEVVRVSGRMGDYAPTGFDSDSDAELSKLAALAREAWALADGSSLDGRGLVPGRAAFILFHAGVGRDLELVGTALDKTPEDLPSLFLSGETLDRLAPGAAPVVAGLPVGNTLVIPRTETRRGFNFITDENFLAEFSINGLLAASFLNFLGVPDLFDTETGQSAVGPFDVMDGLGIFAMQGLFPPEPSAWTRAYLGWADVRTATLTEAGTSYTLPHAGSTDRASVLRVPISAAEYFLVENRYRSSAGVTLLVRKDGVEQEIAFPNDSETFNPYTIDGFEGGVVVAAAPYDFALPGGEDEDGNPLIGGALIWHVDERRLAETLATNRVNADKERRAIDLEEADSAQDIGYPSGGFFGPSYDAGSPFDFWYEGNPVSVRAASGQDLRLYENRFGPDTWPASRANDGGASFVEIGRFSPPGEVMEVSLLAVPEAGLGAPNVLFEANAVHRSQFGGFRSVKLLPDNYLLFASLAESHAEIRTKNRGEGGSRSPEPAIFAEGDLYTLSFDEVRLHDGNGSREVARLPTGMVRRTTTPMVIDDTDPPGFDVGVYGDFGPRILSYADGIVTSRTEPEVVASLARTDDGLLLVCGLTGTRIDGTEISWTYPALPWSPAGPEETIRYRPMFGRDRLGYFGAVASAGALRLLQPDGTVVSLGSDLPRSGIPGETDVATEFDRLNLVTAVDDLDGDGVLEAVVVSMNLVWAFHRTGAVFDGFPITLHAEAGPGAPLVTRMSASGGKTILVGLVDGTIEAFDLGNGGRRLPGFPLVGGHGVMYTPAVAADRIGALDADGVFRVWNLEAPAEPAMSLVSAGNSSFVVVDPGSEPGAAEFLLDPSETYNWPNPVQDGRTWIRFRLSEPADVTVRIIDLAGRFIEELEHPSAPAGTPIEIGWAANVESGVYVARVHAQTAGGRSEDRLVKIAVIR